jgi:hypothetical protein
MTCKSGADGGGIWCQQAVFFSQGSVLGKAGVGVTSAVVLMQLMQPWSYVRHGRPCNPLVAGASSSGRCCRRKGSRLQGCRAFEERDVHVCARHLGQGLLCVGLLGF